MDSQTQQNSPDLPLDQSPNGRYIKLPILLGKGSCKVVWKSLDREEGVEVAWNSVKTSLAEYSELSQEIEILKRIRHPNIITFHDSWLNDVDQEFVFITELMSSGTLREYIKTLHPVNPKIMRRWSKQILKGLSYLHSHNPPIIHRDLKCDNIFINGAQGEAKIGDLGTAKMKKGQKYTIVGTPEFMAPEMYEEQGYNEAVDIYAFGMCLLEMATGEYPYSECKNAAQIYKRVSQGIKPECLSRIKDEELLHLIMGCLAPVNERLSLEAILAHGFISSEPEISLVSIDESSNKITMQLLFKGSNKSPIKFDFYTDCDTAEAVVNEMIAESYLESTFRLSVEEEIGRIVRESIRYSSSPRQKEGGGRLLAEAMSRLNIRFPTNHSSPITQTVPSLLTEFSLNDETSIEKFVAEAAMRSRRTPEKAQEWTECLKRQDILKVHDLKQLQDEDWKALGLTVFAVRALKNLLLDEASLDDEEEELIFEKVPL
jgi:serine/threonine protein kinase